MKKNLLLICLSFLFVLDVFGVMAYPYPVEYQLPDNTTITVLLKGDERVHWAMTLDGYTLMLNSEGFYEYAVLDEDGNLEASGVRANNVQERSIVEITFLSNIPKNLCYSNEQVSIMLQLRDMNNSFAEKIAEREANGGSKDFVGEAHAPVILVGFQGKPFTKTKAEFEALMNQVNYTAGGLTGSVYDYFYASSYGQLQFTVDVFGPYTLSNNISYYDNKCSGGNSRRMAKEAAQAAYNDGCNFANYDIDNDGYVDGLHIIFAGYGQEAGASVCQSIWSHAWSIYDEYFMLNGKRVYRFSCSPELRGNSGNNLTYIGVIAHELSHVFGLPDLYDTDYTGSNGNAVDLGQWDIMASGSWNDSGRTPALHSAWCKDFLGWVHASTISSAATITIPNPAIQGASYRINTTTNNEYFLVENRQELGWDTFIPGSGMLIYHVNENNSGWNSNCINCNPNNRGLYVKQANGGANSNANHGSNTPYPTNDNATFTDVSTPNSKSWAGNNTAKPITNITRNTANRTITFDFMGGSSGTTYTINASANPAVGGNISGTGTYNEGVTATLIATANTGYTFANWTENGNTVSTNASYSFNVTSNRTLVANFNINSYSINTSSNPSNGGNVTGGGSYNHGESATLIATANAGYTFANWTENGNTVSTNASYSFIVTSNRTFVANFTLNTYDINVSSSPAAGGNVTGGGSYNHGESVTLTATSSAGYTFVNWKENGNIVSTNAIYSFSATSNRTLVAVFASSNANLASLTVNPGVLTPSFNANILNYNVTVDNSVATISIIGVAQGARATVSGNVTNAPIEVGNNNFTITVTAQNGNTKLYNVVVVRQDIVSYEIEANVFGSGGAIFPSGKVIVDEGENQTFTITVEDNYTLNEILIDGVNNLQAILDKSYTFENVTSNHTIEVIITCLSVEELSNGIKIYPNPTKNYFVIESEEQINNVVIFNSNGKKIIEKKNIEKKFVQINIDELSAGIYYVKVNDTLNKIIKE